jgi:hypothetical protein
VKGVMRTMTKMTIATTLNGNENVTAAPMLMTRRSHGHAVAVLRQQGRRSLKLGGSAKVPTPVVMPPRIPKGYGV